MAHPMFPPPGFVRYAGNHVHERWFRPSDFWAWVGRECSIHRRAESKNVERLGRRRKAT